MTWREGPQDTQDTAEMCDWERAAYAYAKEVALTRGDLLRLGGLGLGGLLVGPVAGANARSWASSRVQQSTLVVGRPWQSTGLDPQLATGVNDAEVMYQLYDTLVYVDNKGDVYPGLATAWSFNRDGRVIKFKLRRGVVFHDGTAFDANAVKFSLDRWRDPKTASPTAASLAGLLTDVLVDDRYTVRLVYKQPSAAALVSLASSAAAIISEAGVKKYGAQYRRNPIGTGPYRFVEWRADGTIVLERNTAHNWATPYYRAPTGKPLARGPIIDNVELRVIPAEATRLAALSSREIDLVWGGTAAVATNQVAGLRRQRNMQVLQVPYGLQVMVLNAARPPLSDFRTRQALSYAIDRKKLVALAIDGQGKPATGVLATIFPSHDPAVAKYSEYSLDKARSLLRAAGQRNGFTIDYAIYDVATDAQKRAAQIIQQDLAKIKVKMNINVVPLSVFVDDLLKKPLAEKSNAFLQGYTAATSPDAGGILSLLFRQAGLWALFSDRVLNSWLETQATIINRKKRQVLLSRIQRRIAERAYTIPLYEPRSTVVAQNYVRNIRLDWLTMIHLQELTRA
jgi:peptide/nickel transport system substrate-binding protein